MIINHNIAALNTHRQLGSNNAAAASNLEKLSSGLKINRAGDDAAGLAISEKMRSQIRGLDMAQKNAQDGISLIQTAEGALNETHDILQRMRELATQAANDTNTDSDRGEIQKEINQLTSEINRIANTTEFNTKKVLDGGKSAAAAGGTGSTGDATAGTAQAPVLEGADISSLLATDIAATDMDLNGQTVALTNVDGLDGTGNPVTMDELVTALQADIDAVYDGTAHNGVEFTVGITEDGKGLTITSSETGADAKIELTAGAETAALGLTADTTTDATATGQDAPTEGGNGEIDSEGAKFTATLQIGANKGQAFLIDIEDMSAAALGISQSSSANGAGESTGGATGTSQAPVLEGKDISSLLATDIAATDMDLNGQTVALTNVDGLDGTGNPVTMDELVTALQADIDAVYDGTAHNGVEFTVGITEDGKGLTITSSETGADAKIELTAGAETAALGLTADTTTDATATGQDASAGEGTETAGSFTGQPAVSNGTDNNYNESALDVSSHTNATNAIEILDKAIAKVSGERSKLGAFQNRLEHTINNLGTSSENLTAAESRIRDVDYVLTAA